jgi:hypothetical protein
MRKDHIGHIVPISYLKNRSFGQKLLFITTLEIPIFRFYSIQIVNMIKSYNKPVSGIFHTPAVNFIGILTNPFNLSGEQ